MVLLLSVAGLSHCADTLLTSEGYPGKPPGGVAKKDSSTKDLGGGLYETQIDATSTTAWSYFDFESQSEIAVTDPLSNSTWDIAFQRFKIKVNGGGVTGNANGAVVPINGDNFSARTSAPNPFTPALVDVTDAGDANDACRPTTDNVKYAFLDSTQVPNACWFSYSSGVLTPRNIVYVVRTATPKYYKVKLIGYYSETGTSGNPTFQWAEVAAP
jgi:hypothetical protein